MKKEYIFPPFVGAGSNYKLCPHAIFLPVDYEAYVAASQQFKSVMKTLCPIMEVMGIDEAFLDISELPEENDIMWKRGTSVKKLINLDVANAEVLQIRGGKGEAVLMYCEPLPTKEMQHHTAFPKGKN